MVGFENLFQGDKKCRAQRYDQHVEEFGCSLSASATCDNFNASAVRYNTVDIFFNKRSPGQTENSAERMPIGMCKMNMHFFESPKWKQPAAISRDQVHHHFPTQTSESNRQVYPHSVDISQWAASYGRWALNPTRPNDYRLTKSDWSQSKSDISTFEVPFVTPTVEHCCPPRPPVQRDFAFEPRSHFDTLPLSQSISPGPSSQKSRNRQT